MSNCLYGSEPSPSAPDSFTIDSGAICSILGIDSPICPLLDKIPSVIGKPWKEILASVALDGLDLVVDLVTNRIDTASFCSSPPPPLPEEITYQDVFQFIASYIPPFSEVASSSPLLNKLGRYYLYDKWFQFCQCKNKRRLPEDESAPVVPPFSPSCPTSALLSSDMQALIDFVNGRNANGFGNPQPFYLTDNNSGEQSWITESEYNDIRNQYEDGNVWELLLQFNETIDGSDAVGVGNVGCIVTEIRGGDYKKELMRYVVRRISDSIERDVILAKWTYNLMQISWNEEECCRGQEPPRPRLPKPPTGGDCIPTPPPEFCRLFPTDPLCSNVPPNEDGECLPTVIVVSDYDCQAGRLFKQVEWKI